MITAWYMEAAIQPNTFGDWAKLEGERSKLNDSQLSLLAQWHCSREQNDLLKKTSPSRFGRIFFN